MSAQGTTKRRKARYAKQVLCGVRKAMMTTTKSLSINDYSS